MLTRWLIKYSHISIIGDLRFARLQFKVTNEFDESTKKRWEPYLHNGCMTAVNWQINPLDGNAGDDVEVMGGEMSTSSLKTVMGKGLQ